MSTVEGKPVFLKLPYVTGECEEYATRLKTLVKTNYPQTDFNVAFQAPMTIGKLFPFKDTIKNVKDRSLVVYSIECNKCRAEYVGKTERILHYRIKEHRSDAKSNNSACKEHERSHRGHIMDYDEIKILDSADNNKKLVIKELLHILRREPILNKQLNSQSGFEIKTLIITAYPQFRES